MRAPLKRKRLLIAVAGLVAGALSAKKASPEELAKIRQLLDDAEEDAR